MHPKQELIDLLSTAVPNGDRIIVVPEEVEKMTKSGIMRAQTAKGESETQLGMIAAVGPGYTAENENFLMWMIRKMFGKRFIVGSRVVLDRYAGVTMRLDKQGKMHPQSVDITDDLLPFKVVRREAILFVLPGSWPV